MNRLHLYCHNIFNAFDRHALKMNLFIIMFYFAIHEQKHKIVKLTIQGNERGEALGVYLVQSQVLSRGDDLKCLNASYL